MALKPCTLQNTDDLNPSADIWLKSKQDWFELPTDTKHFQGQPLSEELIESDEEAYVSYPNLPTKSSALVASL